MTAESPSTLPIRTDFLSTIGQVLRHKNAKIAFAVLFVTATYMWRSGDGITTPQLFGEDGRVFFTEARTFGLSSISVPYAGYLHVVPRLVALACLPFSATVAPALYISATVLIVACVAAITATCRHRHAWLLACCIAVVPVGGEIFGLLTNEQWFGQVGLLMITITASPRSRIIRLLQIAFLLIFALDGPFAILAAPLAALRLWTRRHDVHSQVVGLVVLSAAALQLSFALQVASPYEGIRDPRHLAAVMLDRWIGQSAHRGLTLRPPAYRADVVFFSTLVFALATSEVLALKMLAYVSMSLVTTFARFIGDSRYFDGTDFGDRYFYVPRLAIMWCFVLCAVRARWTSVFGLVGLAMMALSFDPWVRTPLPVLPWRDGALKIDQGRAVDILINPSEPGDTTPDPWIVRVPGRP